MTHPSKLVPKQAEPEKKTNGEGKDAHCAQAKPDHALYLRFKWTGVNVMLLCHGNLPYTSQK